MGCDYSIESCKQGCSRVREECHVQPGFWGTEKRLFFQKQAQKKRQATLRSSLVLAYMVLHFGGGGGERGGGERGLVVYYCSGVMYELC